MWLVEKGLLYVSVVIAFSSLLSILWWMALSPLRSQLLIKWRTRRNLKRQRQFNQEWNPRPTALRQFSQARVVSFRKDVH